MPRLHLENLLIELSGLRELSGAMMSERDLEGLLQGG
jgi:hypothetical protein